VNEARSCIEFRKKIFLGKEAKRSPDNDFETFARVPDYTESLSAFLQCRTSSRKQKNQVNLFLLSTNGEENCRIARYEHAVVRVRPGLGQDRTLGLGSGS
jgi:hypothetical protein